MSRSHFLVEAENIRQTTAYICALLNTPNGGVLDIIRISSYTSPDWRALRDSYCIYIDALLTEQIVPPTDPRNIQEIFPEDYERKTEGYEIILRLRIQNSLAEYYPNLMRCSAFDRIIYTIDNEHRLNTLDSTDVNCTRSAQFGRILQLFAIPVLRTLMHPGKQFLGRESQWGNYVLLCLTVVAICPDEGCTTYSPCKMYRWFLAARNRKQKSLVTVGYIRTPAKNHKVASEIYTNLEYSTFSRMSYHLDTTSLIRVGGSRALQAAYACNWKNTTKKPRCPLYNVVVECGIGAFSNFQQETPLDALNFTSNDAARKESECVLPNVCIRLHELQLHVLYTPPSLSSTLRQIQKLAMLNNMSRIGETENTLPINATSSSSIREKTSGLPQNMDITKCIAGIVSNMNNRTRTAFSVSGKLCKQKLLKLVSRQTTVLRVGDQLNGNQSFETSFREFKSSSASNENELHKTDAGTREKSPSIDDTCTSKILRVHVQRACTYATSFLNTYGGILFMGVNDDGLVSGINAENCMKISSAFRTGLSGVRPVVNQHMTHFIVQRLEPVSKKCRTEETTNFTETKHETKARDKRLIQFAVCDGPAPFYTAGNANSAPAYGRFLASTIPMHSSVLLERLVSYAHSNGYFSS